MSRFSKEIYLAIAQRIKSRRESLGIKQSEIAKLLRLDRSAITRIENGSRHLEDAIDLFLIAEKLQIPMISFFSEETKLLVEKLPKYPEVFSLLPEQVRANVCLSQEAIGSISSGQLYALLEIFKSNPWGKIRRMVAGIFPLLRDTWASSKVIDEMECILLPNQGQEVLRFHTRLLSAGVLSSFVLSSDGLLSSRGKDIQRKIEQRISVIQNPNELEFLFLLEALANLGVRNTSAIKIEEAYPIIRSQINNDIQVCHLIFAYQWGEFYKKDGVSPRLALESCLNLILAKSVSSVYDFCLKIWAQSLKALYFSYRTDWLESIFDNSVYPNLSGNEKASLIIVSLCASIHEFSYVQDQNSDQAQVATRQKDQIHRLYSFLIDTYEEVQNSLVKMWILQTLLFLREQEISQAPYTVGLSIEPWLERVFEDVFCIFQSSSNPMEQALALDFILSSRIEKQINRAMRIVYDFLDSNTGHGCELLYSLLIDIFCRTDLKSLIKAEFNEESSTFDEFCQNPFTYMCHRFRFSNLSFSGNGEFSSVEESWVCSAILRQETSASAHKYFIPALNTGSSRICVVL
jgi:DNA-binding XRE family transcriptional regulator